MKRTGPFTAAIFIAALILGPGALAGEYMQGGKGKVSQTGNQQISAGEELRQFTITDLQGQKIGQIDEVIVDLQQGRIGYVVTSSAQQGQKHVIPWHALQVDPQQQTLTLQMNADQLQKQGADVAVDSDQARRIDLFYGVAPVWGTTTAQGTQIGSLQDLQQFKVQNPQGQQLGKVDQVLVDVQRGEIGYVVVTSQQGQKHVIPWNALQSNMQQQTLILPISAQRFQQAPTGDAQIVRDLSQARQIHQFYGVLPYYEVGSLPPAQTFQQQIGQQQTLAQFPQLQVKSVDTLKQYTLQDQQGQRLGPISQVLVDVQRGQIGYIVVTSQAGQQHLIPWNALRIDAQQQTLALPMTASQLQQLPTLDERMVQDVNQARQIHQFFGVSPYWESAQQPMQRSQQQIHQPMHQQMQDQMQQMHQQRRQLIQ